MKWFFLCICFFFIHLPDLISQNAYTIVPGEGIGRIQLGISKKRALKILGKPAIRENYKEAIVNMEELKSNPYNWIAFQVHFDSVFTFTEGPESYPVHSLYFTNDSLVSFSLSAFNYKKWWMEKFHIHNKVYFNNNIQTVKDSLDLFHGVFDYSQGRMKFTTNTYYSQGVSIMFHKDKVKMIEIFKPVDIIETFGGHKVW